MASEDKVKYVLCSTSTDDQPLGDPSKPTLLAFHGSGSNSTCHRVQLARLNLVLKNDFNIICFEAPFPSPAGPGILPFFEGCGPFARWLPPTEKVTIDAMRHGHSTSSMAPEVESLIRETITAIRATGSRVVGLIGFSQGTKVVAGLLRGAQIRKTLGVDKEDWCDFMFGVSVCASYPPPLVPQSIQALLDEADLPAERKEELASEKIGLPVYHVQGLKDEWKWAGENLIAKHYGPAEEGGSVREELDMGHQYPLRSEESERIAKWCVEQLQKGG